MSLVQPKQQLLIWNQYGTLILDRTLSAKVCSISAQKDCDIQLKELGANSAYVYTNVSGTTLLLQDEKGKTETHILNPGLPVDLGQLRWLICQTSDDSASVKGEAHPATSASSLAVLESLFTWIGQRMTSKPELKKALNDFLQILVNGSSAINGMIVLREDQGFCLAATSGLSVDEALIIWQTMPHNLTEEILRNEARVLLPEGLREKVGNRSTVYVRNIRTLAGFPIMAEGHIEAIFYLGFNNLLVELTTELQQVLQTAGDLAGLVIQRAKLREEMTALKLDPIGKGRREYFPEGRLMVGSSDALNNVYKVISRLAPVDVPTLIVGETGTGKELTAKELHRLSTRSAKPFVAINAAALPESLMESELFGYRKGSFTGAMSDHVGLIEQANGGSLFIDEIAELTTAMQVKLLRILQDKVLLRIGDPRPRAVDFRLIVATHRDLETMIKQGLFREDLYYRIAGAIVHLSPLRERRDDILELANYFKKRFIIRHGLNNKELSVEAQRSLESNPWRGNIRELENSVNRAVVMADGNVIQKKDLLICQNDAGDSAIEELSIEDATLSRAKDVWLRDFLTTALKRHAGKRTETAKALGIGERTLFRYLEQLNIRGV